MVGHCFVRFRVFRGVCSWNSLQTINESNYAADPDLLIQLIEVPGIRVTEGKPLGMALKKEKRF